MRLTDPYRIIFLYPKYQKIVSSSSLLGIALGGFFLFEFSLKLSLNLGISTNTPLLHHPEGAWWMACILTSMPLILYGGVLITGIISGSFLAARGTMSWKDLKGYTTQKKFPAHWFETKPWF